MLSSVTINCQVTKIVSNPGSQLSVSESVSLKSQVTIKEEKKLKKRWENVEKKVEKKLKKFLKKVEKKSQDLLVVCQK